MQITPGRYLITVRFHLTNAQRAQFQPEDFNQCIVNELVKPQITGLAALDNAMASNPTTAFYEYFGEGSSARYDAMIVLYACVLWVQRPVEWDALRWQLSEATTRAVREAAVANPRGDMSGMLNSCSVPSLFCVNQQAAGSYSGNAVPAPALSGVQTRLLYSRGYDPRANRTIAGPTQLTPLGPSIPAPPAPVQGRSILPPDSGDGEQGTVPVWLAAVLGIGLAGVVAYGFWAVTSPKSMAFARRNPQPAGLPSGRRRGSVDIITPWKEPGFDPKGAALAGALLLEDGHGQVRVSIHRADPGGSMSMAEALRSVTDEERKAGKQLQRFVLHPDRSLSLIRPSGGTLHTWAWRPA